MILTIELTPEESGRVENAQALGVDVSAMIRRVIDALPAETQKTIAEQKEIERIAAIRAAAGSFAHYGARVEDLHRERQADRERDERQFEALP